MKDTFTFPPCEQRITGKVQSKALPLMVLASGKVTNFTGLIQCCCPFWLRLPTLQAHLDSNRKQSQFYWGLSRNNPFPSEHCFKNENQDKFICLSQDNPAKRQKMFPVHTPPSHESHKGTSERRRYCQMSIRILGATACRCYSMHKVKFRNTTTSDRDSVSIHEVHIASLDTVLMMLLDVLTKATEGFVWAYILKVQSTSEGKQCQPTIHIAKARKRSMEWDCSHFIRVCPCKCPQSRTSRCVQI